MKRIDQAGQAFRFFALAVALCLSLASSLRAQQAPAVLEQVPADAPMAIVVPSLSGLNKKIAMLGNALGIDSPEMTDALGQVKAALNMTQGLDDNGSMAMIALGTDWITQEGEPDMVLIMPVSDYKAFLANFNPTDAGGVMAVTMPDGQPGFVKKSGTFAVMGPDKAVIEAIKPGNAAALVKNAGPLGQRVMTGSDAMVYFNLAAIAPVLAPKLDQAIKESMDNPLLAADPMAKAMVQFYADAAKAMIRDTNTFVMGMDLSELGVGMTLTASFKPGSPTAKLFPGGGSAKPYLERLPTGPYLMATAMDYKAMDMATIVDAVVKAMQAAPDSPFGEMMKLAVPMTKQSQGMAVVTSVPADANLMNPAGMFNSISLIAATDPKAIVDAYKQMIESMDGKKLAAAPEEGQPASEITFTSQFVPNVMQIDGAQVHQFQMTYQLPPQLLQGNPMAPMLMAMGATGTNGYIAATDKYVVMTSTPDAQAMRQGLAAAKAGQGLGADATLEQIRQQLTPNPAAEFYLSTSGLMNLANNVAAMFMPQPIQVPANLPPIGASMSVADNGVAGRMYVPMAVITAGRDVAMQVQAMQQQRQGDPNQGGPSQGPPPAPF